MHAPNNATKTMQMLYILQDTLIKRLTLLLTENLLFCPHQIVTYKHGAMVALVSCCCHFQPTVSWVYVAAQYGIVAQTLFGIFFRKTDRKVAYSPCRKLNENVARKRHKSTRLRARGTLHSDCCSIRYIEILRRTLCTRTALDWSGREHRR